MKTVRFNCAACGKEKEGPARRPKNVRGSLRYCSIACSSKTARAVPATERFWSKVNKNGPNGCWLWIPPTKGRDDGRPGYGQLWVNGKHNDAHKFSWTLHGHAPVPKGMYLCHTCDNPPCVNPEHLFVGTPKDNMADAKQKGRLGGLANARKLKTDERRQVFSLLRQSIPQVEIAKRIGIGLRSISRYAEIYAEVRATAFDDTSAKPDGTNES